MNRPWISLFAERREAWVLRIWIKITVVVAFLCTSVAVILGAYPYLAITQTHGGGTMVLDGWMPTYLVEQVAAIYRESNYQRLIIARPLRKELNPVESGELVAEYIAELFRQKGVPADAVHILYFSPGKTDRTYQSALTVRAWLAEQNSVDDPLDIFTLGPHARRTRALYRQAFDDSKLIGVHAVEPQDYEPRRWWTSSQGVRDVPFELFAFFYVAFLFDPDEADEVN